MLFELAAIEASEKASLKTKAVKDPHTCTYQRRTVSHRHRTGYVPMNSWFILIQFTDVLVIIAYLLAFALRAASVLLARSCLVPAGAMPNEGSAWESCARSPLLQENGQFEQRVCLQLEPRYEPSLDCIQQPPVSPAQPLLPLRSAAARFKTLLLRVATDQTTRS